MRPSCFSSAVASLIRTLFLHHPGERPSPLGTYGPIQLLCGSGLREGWRTTITATVHGQVAATRFLDLVPYSTAIFTINGQGTGQGAILDSSYKLVDSSNPAIAGQTVLLIFCTGLGAVSNQPATGVAAPTAQLARTIDTPTVMIGEVVAPVQYSGLAPGFVGLYQVNALVPRESAKGDAVNVVMQNLRFPVERGNDSGALIARR